MLVAIVMIFLLMKRPSSHHMTSMTSGPDQICWATTSVDGVSFAVLERMFVTSEVKWGVPAVTQVDLFGRHPTRGFLLLESVTESD